MIMWLGGIVRSTMLSTLCTVLTVVIDGYCVLTLEAVASKHPISLRVIGFLRDILKPFAAATW